jgi:hypothetical protein
VWRITLIGPDGPRETHEIMRSGVGDLVQAIIAAQLPNEAVVVIQPVVDETTSAEPHVSIG